jgi:predicted RND superfamily exporter protein
MMRPSDQSIKVFAAASGRRKSVEQTILRALRELLSRGAKNLSLCVTTALAIAGFLSMIASSLHPHRKISVEASAGCKSGHCGHKTGDGRQPAEFKVQ